MDDDEDLPIDLIVHDVRMLRLEKKQALRLPARRARAAPGKKADDKGPAAKKRGRGGTDKAEETADGGEASVSEKAEHKEKKGNLLL